jgi:hypothetical protein
MRFPASGQGAGEADECTCPQCRGIEVPDWLQRLDHPDEPPEPAPS